LRVRAWFRCSHGLIREINSEESRDSAAATAESKSETRESREHRADITTHATLPCFAGSGRCLPGPGSAPIIFLFRDSKSTIRLHRTRPRPVLSPFCGWDVVFGQASRAAPRDSTHAATKQGSQLAAISTVYQSTSADVAAVRGSSALLTIQQRTGPDCCARPRAGPSVRARVGQQRARWRSESAIGGSLKYARLSLGCMPHQLHRATPFDTTSKGASRFSIAARPRRGYTKQVAKASLAVGRAGGLIVGRSR